VLGLARQQYERLGDAPAAERASRLERAWTDPG
jgi:hypothetical protein